MSATMRPHACPLPVGAPLGAGARAANPILVATDGREAAATAVLTGERVALRLGTTPLALAVLEPLPMYGEVTMPEPPEAEAARAAVMRDAVRRQIEIESGARWPTEVAVGPVGGTIAEIAAERHATLVVLGIGRHRVVDRLLGTETALQTLRSGDRPVLAVGPDADGIFRRAVVAVDFSAASARAAAIACRLLAPGGTLSLVHVKPQLELSEPTWESSDARAGGRVPERLQRLAAGLRHGTTGCDECGADTGRADVTIGTATLVGDPAVEVLDYAERVGADLVAVGTHGAGFVARLLIGSVATDVIRLTSTRLPDCSVLACAAPSPTVAARIMQRLIGTTEAVDPAAWREVLESFGRRNADRFALVEIDDPAPGAQATARACALLGATYDPCHGRAELMLGAPGGRPVTHTIGDVVSVTVLTGPDGHDTTLRIEQRNGETLVTLAPAA